VVEWDEMDAGFRRAVFEFQIETEALQARNWSSLQQVLEQRGCFAPGKARRTEPEGSLASTFRHLSVHMQRNGHNPKYFRIEIDYPRT